LSGWFEGEGSKAFPLALSGNMLLSDARVEKLICLWTQISSERASIPRDKPRDL
jgi:hypothetical protein